MPRIIIAPDSFKGSLSARQVAYHLQQGLARGFLANGEPPLVPTAAVDLSATKLPWQLLSLPLSDGGEGFVDSCLAALGGRWVDAQITDPWGQPVAAGFGWLNCATAVVELAAAAGWHLLPPAKERDRHDPWQRTTRGVGELIKAALDYGARRIVVGLGGSITHDVGAGLAQALGVGLTRADGQPIAAGARGLAQLQNIDLSQRDRRLEAVDLLVAHDVNNPLLGPDGAAAVYAQQKGFPTEQLVELEQATAHFARQIEQSQAFRTPVAARALTERAGTGAAGGAGFGLAALLGAKLVPGAHWLLNEIGAPALFTKASLIITGEGRLDATSQHDKLVKVVANMARPRAVPVIAVCGALAGPPESFRSMGLQAALSIVPQPMSLEQAIDQAPQLLAWTGFNLARLLILGQSFKGIPD